MREYEVKVGGISHRMQLDERDARRYGVEGQSSASKAAVPATKARRPRKAADGDQSDD